MSNQHDNRTPTTTPAASARDLDAIHLDAIASALEAATEDATCVLYAARHDTAADFDKKAKPRVDLAHRLAARAKRAIALEMIAAGVLTGRATGEQKAPAAWALGVSFVPDHCKALVRALGDYERAILCRDWEDKGRAGVVLLEAARKEADRALAEIYDARQVRAASRRKSDYPSTWEALPPGVVSLYEIAHEVGAPGVMVWIGSAKDDTGAEPDTESNAQDAMRALSASRRKSTEHYRTAEHVICPEKFPGSLHGFQRCPEIMPEGTLYLGVI